MTPLDWTHAVRDIPAEGLAVERIATPDEAKRVAEALEIVGMERLAAKYRLVPRPGARVALTGTIDAHVVQECVVTLEPVPATLRLPLDVIFTTAVRAAETPLDASLGDLEGPDEEPIENGVIDVGRIVLEELLSGLDPYPRAPGASFEWSEPQDEAANDNPFAVLSRMNKPRDAE